MSVIIINPNSSTIMTDAMVEVARAAAPEINFEGWTSHNGPPSIQGEADGALAAPHLLELVRKAEREGAEGVIIGCFDDTALAEARKLASCPIIGIGQAAYYYAALQGWRFSVVTTLSVSVPILERNISALGLDQFLGKVRASEVPVLALHEDRNAAAALVAEESRRAEAQDGVDAIILGCAGMVSVVDAVRNSVGLHVVDPAVVAPKCVGWLR